MKKSSIAAKRLDRRSFLGLGVAAVATSATLPAVAADAQERVPPAGDDALSLGGEAESAKTAAETPVGAGPLKKEPVKIRFLGTGAYDWRLGKNEFGELRRYSSILIDDRILVDFTPGNFEMLPEGVKPEVIFYTHTHSDHYRPDAAMDLGVKRIYCHHSIAERVRREFAAAANGRPLPKVVPLEFGEGAVECGVRLTPLAANHSAGPKAAHERCAFYMIESGKERIFYATDTCGIPRDALKYAGLGRFPKHPLTAIIMEATAGMGHEDDPRFFFSHSSVGLVARTVRALSVTGRYVPPKDRPVYITHMIRAQYAAQADLDKTLPAPLKAAYDGLEVSF